MASKSSGGFRETVKTVGWAVFIARHLLTTGWLGQGLYWLVLSSIIPSFSAVMLGTLGLAILLQGTRFKWIRLLADSRVLRWLGGVVLGIWFAVLIVAGFRLLIRPTGPNVVLIVVDALRADHLGAYGYQPPSTPHLDALAERSTLFLNAFSSSTHTVPAMATIFSSTLPPIHRVTPEGGEV